MSLNKFFGVGQELFSQKRTGIRIRQVSSARHHTSQIAESCINSPNMPVNPKRNTARWRKTNER